MWCQSHFGLEDSNIQPTLCESTTGLAHFPQTAATAAKWQVTCDKCEIICLLNM
jgi:hypothetical protein